VSSEFTPFHPGSTSRSMSTPSNPIFMMTSILTQPLSSAVQPVDEENDAIFHNHRTGHAAVLAADRTKSPPPAYMSA
jgi:hypothetical protein